MKDQPELPCYLRIADELRARLRLLPLGAPFDTEQALVKAYGVSRGTIRQALDVLEREGLLVRSQGRGSFRSQSDAYTFHMELSSDVAQSVRGIGRNSDISHLSITLVPAPPEVADHLNIPHGTKVRKVSRVRTVNGESFAYCVGYVRTDLVPPFFKRDFSSSFSELVRNTLHLHIGSRSCLLLADAADRTTADALHIPVNAPILRLRFLCRTHAGEPMLVDTLNFTPSQTLHFEVTEISR